MSSSSGSVTHAVGLRAQGDTVHYKIMISRSGSERILSFSALTHPINNHPTGATETSRNEYPKRLMNASTGMIASITRHIADSSLSGAARRQVRQEISVAWPKIHRQSNPAG